MEESIKLLRKEIKWGKEKRKEKKREGKERKKEREVKKGKGDYERKRIGVEGKLRGGRLVYLPH